MAPQSSAKSITSPDPLLEHFDPLDAIDDLLSLESPPDGTFDFSDQLSDDSLSTWRLSSNAVHMELQENAKLPTFNLSVDRTGSTYSYQSKTLRDLEEMSRLENEDINLTERFLKSHNRASMQANYAQAGVLSRDATRLGQLHKTEPASEMTCDVAEKADDMETDFDPNDPFFKALSLDTVSLDAIPEDIVVKRLMKSSSYPYERSQPLPIPNEKLYNSSEELAVDNLLVSNEATVAALAAGDQLQKPFSVLTSKSPASSHMIAPSGALEYASKTKSQYGFGSNHRVPAVPKPPVAMKQKQSRTGVNRTTVSSTASLPPAVLRPPSIGPSSLSSVVDSINDCGGVNSTVAYERKKQRAKDARIKLNDAIERMGIAINLAGTQSRVRLQQWQASESPHVQTGSRIMQECIQTAESAKKWDRPSFVNSAATLIQSLNSQCESLIREVCLLRDQQETERSHERNVANPPSEHVVLPAKRSTSKSSVRAEIERFQKRIRLEPRETHMSTTVSLTDEMCTPDGTIFSHDRVMNCIASYLDPITMIRCHEVSRDWRGCGSFDHRDRWETLAILRFGSYNVRQWRGKMDEEGEETITPMNLYRGMDNANVMPHFCHDGMFLLGETRLPGKVSAWTFLVERSNGETVRSVKRDPSIGLATHGSYTPLPVVQLRTVLQNTGVSDGPIIIQEQGQTVDASTRRRGEEMKEIDWDDRLHKRLLNLDGTSWLSAVNGDATNSSAYSSKELCRLYIYDTVVLETYIHARSCPTTSKFVQRANFTKVFVQVSLGVTIPIVIPFPRDALHSQL